MIQEIVSEIISAAGAMIFGLAFIAPPFCLGLILGDSLDVDWDGRTIFVICTLVVVEFFAIASIIFQFCK